ncbi:MAG: cell wall-binding repeat-containing protein [Ornithinimicrobium sp.]|uniref:cell wall-binding repeat-containing protein n=1 Tax=Ornithinimicrobium sp. TaxID=1977084 RepID=UPI003D9B5506
MAPEPTQAVTVPTADPCNGGPAVTRVSGTDRYATSAGVSQEWPGGQAVAFVVSGQTYPDAVSASGRAADVNAPVLLTRRDSVPAQTAQALRRLRPDRIVVVGGTAAVSTNVARQLGRYASRPVERVSGSNRYATSAAVAGKYSPGQSKVFLASGEDFPDALAGSALAGDLEVPLLLTPRDRLDAATVALLRKLAAREVVVLGGSGVISSAVAKQAAAYSTSGRWSRLAGADRYATAEAIAKQFPRGAERSYVASGQLFPDALVGAALAGRRGAPMILTPRSGLAAGTRGALEHQRPEAISVLGGSKVVSSAVLRSLARYAAVSENCRPMLGGYLGSANESPDERFKANFGAYPDLASTYYQAQGRGGGRINFDYERSRISRGTIPVLTVTSRKGPWTMEQIGSGAADKWIDSWVADLAKLDAEVWFTFEHEFEVKLNQGQLAKGTTVAQYIRAYNRFQSRVKAGAPKVKFLYWYGYFDTAKIDAIGTGINRPDVVALDPYVFKHRPASTTFEQMAQPKLQWLRGRSWYAGQPIIFAEFAKDTRFGDANVARFLSNLRPRLADLRVTGAIYFARDKGPADIEADITQREWDQARAAYRRSVVQ